MNRIFALISVLLLLGLVPGCAPKITTHERKEAANLVSEAQFASTLRDWERAEELTARAVALCPDSGEYWLNLGSIRRRLGDLSGTRTAYVQAAKAYGDAYKSDPKNPQPLMQQVYVYALLGRQKDALKSLRRVHADHGTNPGVRNFTEQALERLREDPAYKALAL